MLLFIPRSLCALNRVAAKAEHARFGATTDIRIALASGLYRPCTTMARSLRRSTAAGEVADDEGGEPGLQARARNDARLNSRSTRADRSRCRVRTVSPPKPCRPT